MTLRSSLSSIYPSTIAVYILVLNSGHYYIGSTNNLVKRLRDHRSYLESGKHQNFKVQRWYEGWDNLKISFTTHDTVEESLDEEQRLIDRHYDDPYCCNLATDSRSIWGNGKGRPVEISERIASAQRGKVVTDEFRETCRQRMLGNKPSDLTRQRTSDSLKGRTFSDEHKVNLSISLKGKLLGTKHSDQQKQRRADTWASRGGFKHTEVSRQQIAEANMIPVIIDGVRYESYAIAAKVFGVVGATIRNRVNSPNFPTYNHA